MRLAGIFFLMPCSEFIMEKWHYRSEIPGTTSAKWVALFRPFYPVWVADRFIHHLYVDEAYQNQQIGTQLLNAIISKFGLPLRLKCEEKNTKAINFYQRKGFVEIEKGQSQSGLYILFKLR